MRTRRAVLLGLVLALCGAATAGAAPTTATPTCKTGQISTTNSSCLPAPIAIDPGETGERPGLGDAVTATLRWVDIPRGLLKSLFR